MATPIDIMIDGYSKRFSSSDLLQVLGKLLQYLASA